MRICKCYESVSFGLIVALVANDTCLAERRVLLECARQHSVCHVVAQIADKEPLVSCMGWEMAMREKSSIF